MTHTRKMETAIVTLMALLLASILMNLLLGFKVNDRDSRIDALAWVINQNADAHDAEQLRKDQVAAWIVSNNKRVPVLVAQQWAEAFIRASDYYSISLELLKRVSIVESGVAQTTPYGYTLVSYAGAEGIMQVMPKYWAGKCPWSSKRSDLRSATVNIWCGAYVLDHYRDTYKDLHKALTAYNGGPAAVRMLERGIDVTDGYAGKVINVRL